MQNIATDTKLQSTGTISKPDFDVETGRKASSGYRLLKAQSQSGIGIFRRCLVLGDVKAAL